MAHLDRSVASLRIFGDELRPEEITRLLGHPPTEAWLKGESLTRKSGRTLPRRSGAWFLKATAAQPENLDGQVAELLGKITDDPAVWSELTHRYEVDLFCGWFMGTSNEGVSVSPATLLALGRLGIELSLDIYGPDREEESDVASAQPTVQLDGPASGGSAS